MFEISLLLTTAAILWWIRQHPRGVDPLLRAFAWPPRTGASPPMLRSAASVLILVALLFALNPEARLFLMAVDSIGLDLFVAICALYLRHEVAFWLVLLGVPLLRTIYRLGPVPGFWPFRSVIGTNRGLALYAVLYPAVVIMLAGLCAGAVIIGSIGS